MKQNKIFTYGKYALKEALSYAPRSLTKVYLDHKAIDTKLKRQIEQAGIPISKLSEGMARSDMKSGTPHQGIIGQVSLPQLLVPYQKFLDTVQATRGVSLVLLAGVQDPHNVGAIIRSAAGFGVSAVLLPEVGQAPITSSVIKVSAGMAFCLPLVTTPSAKQTVFELKKRGFKIYVLAGDVPTATALPKVRFDSPAVFILGNEGVGVPDDILKLATEVLAIPIDPRCESLNVAAAAAVTLYAWSTANRA